jgi:hypothetical protein
VNVTKKGGSFELGEPWCEGVWILRGAIRDGWLQRAMFPETTKDQLELQARASLHFAEVAVTQRRLKDAAAEAFVANRLLIRLAAL